jgi:hypothetical protein
VTISLLAHLSVFKIIEISPPGVGLNQDGPRWPINTTLGLDQAWSKAQIA